LAPPERFLETEAKAYSPAAVRKREHFITERYLAKTGRSVSSDRPSRTPNLYMPVRTLASSAIVLGLRFV